MLVQNHTDVKTSYFTSNSFGEQPVQTQLSKMVFLDNLVFTRLLRVQAPTHALCQDHGVR